MGVTERKLEVSLTGALLYSRARARQAAALGAEVPSLVCEARRLDACKAGAPLRLGEHLPYCEVCGWTMTLGRLEQIAGERVRERAAELGLVDESNADNDCGASG
jgi:hypothetical protein